MHKGVRIHIRSKNDHQQIKGKKISRINIRKSNHENTIHIKRGSNDTKEQNRR